MSTDKLEELIRRAQELTEEDKEEKPKARDRRSRYTTSVKRFLRERNITSGNIKVPVYKLVHEYNKWEKGSSNKASPKELGRIISHYFKKHRSGAYRYYLLNEFCDMSREEMLKSKEYYRMYFLRRKTRNVRKKKKQEVQQVESSTNIET